MRARSSGVLFTFALVGILMQHSLSPSSAAASRTAPYSQWESPVSAAMVAEQGLSFGELVTRGEAVYWIERRPEEGGRNAIVRHADGASIDVIPTGFNARNRVHEYGGGDIAPGPDGAVHFVNFADQRLYRVLPGQEPAAISPEGPWRFADCVLDAGRDRLICVGEDHGGGGEPRNLIVAVSMKGGEIVELAGGSDFAASPRIDPTGSRLAWITWDHPDMPWDKTTLWLADIASDGSLRNVRKVADDAAIQQPQWASDGSLHYLSDAGGWWNIHVFDGGQSRPLHGTEADFADPAWVFNRSSYAILDDVIVAVMTKDASDRLVRIDRASGKVEEIETSYVRIGYVRPFGPEGVVFVGAGTTAPAEVVRLDLASGRTDVLADAGKVGVGPEWISAARAITVPVGGDEVTHAFYYPPKNPDFTAPEGPGDGIRPDPVHPGRLAGGASLFLDRLTGELREAAEQGLPIDPARRCLWGHSFGGLFTLYALLTRPGAFARFDSISPSIWWDEPLIRRIAAQAGRIEPPPPLLMALGDREKRSGSSGPPPDGPAPATMQFIADLRDQQGLDPQVHVLPGLIHIQTIAGSLPLVLPFAAA